VIGDSIAFSIGPESLIRKISDAHIEVDFSFARPLQASFNEDVARAIFCKCRVKNGIHHFYATRINAGHLRSNNAVVELQYECHHPTLSARLRRSHA
jgi:hypothetical protein